MSKPTVFDKNKWDTTLGLDYSNPLKIYPKPYVHHDFPPLFKDTRLIAQYDLAGRGDSFQIAKKGDYLFICHLWSSGFSVVDVKDPTSPKTVFFESTDNPHQWSLKCRVVGDILVVSHEWKFFESEIYALNTDLPNFHDWVSMEPVKSGIKIYDVSNPAEPKLLSFYETGKWVKEGGCNACHRFWFDGHYVYLSAEVPGWYGNIMLIIDVSEPTEPREVSRFWMPGQWTAGGERPWWPTDMKHRCQHHHPIIRGNRAYTTWFGLGAAILDITNIKIPTMISHVNYDLGGQTHTFLPILDRRFAVLVNEYRHTYMLDISDEKYPRVIAMFPKPPNELLSRGGGVPWGPSIHNIHEHVQGPDSFRSDEVIFATAGPGGLRIYDIRDPYRIEEIGYYVPGTPEVYHDPRGPEHASFGVGIDVTDLWVDEKGIIYITSYNSGLEILEFTGKLP